MAHCDAQLKNFIKDHQSFNCHAIDFGSAHIDANKSLMGNDYSTLALEFQHFDKYFEGSHIHHLWLSFKSDFHSHGPDTLFKLIDDFQNSALRSLRNNSSFVAGL